MKNILGKNIILAIFLLSFLLNIYGIDWGLPARWNVDQTVTTSLRLAGDRTIFPRDNIRPAFYYYLNLLVLAPYFIFLKFSGFPMSELTRASQLSWNSMALLFPDVSRNIFIISRLLSAVFGSLTVLVVYKIGEILFSRRTAILAAAILAVTMGFSVFNHLARSVALVNLLSMVSLFYCFKCIKVNRIDKNFYYACIFAGLSFAVKYNGLFLILPVVLTYYLVQKGQIYRRNFLRMLYLNKKIFMGAFFFVLTFIIASPSVFLNAVYYVKGLSVYRGAGFVPLSLKESLVFLPYNLLGLSKTLINIFGIPLGISALLGFAYFIKRLLYKKEIKIIIAFILFVFTVFSLLPRVKLSPDSKFIIQTVPLFALAAAVFLERYFFRKFQFKTKKNRIFSSIIIFFIFTWSLFYCVSLDLIFKKNDIRYQATEWIKSNLPPESRIILMNELEWSLGIEVLNGMDVFVLASASDGETRPMNYKFVGKQYSRLRNDDVISIREQIEQGLEKGSFLVIPYSNFEPEKKISALRSKGMKIVRVFERIYPWYFSPNLGGYEPDKIFLMASNDAMLKVRELK